MDLKFINEEQINIESILKQEVLMKGKYWFLTASGINHPWADE